MQFMFLIPGALIAAVTSAVRNSRGMAIPGQPVRPAIPKTSGLRNLRVFLEPVILLWCFFMQNMDGNTIIRGLKKQILNSSANDFPVLLP